MSNTIEHLVAMANYIGAFFDGEVGRAAVKMLPTPAAR